MFVWGPALCALIIGFIIGTRFKSNHIYTLSSFIIVLIVAFLFANGVGQFPYYNDFGFSTPFLFGVIGLLLGKFIFDR